MDVVTKLNSRLFQAVPSFGARVVLAQRAYMKANTLVKKQRVATTVYGSTMERRIDDNIDRRIYFLAFGNQI